MNFLSIICLQLSFGCYTQVNAIAVGTYDYRNNNYNEKTNIVTKTISVFGRMVSYVKMRISFFYYRNKVMTKVVAGDNDENNNLKTDSIYSKDDGKTDEMYYDFTVIKIDNEVALQQDIHHTSSTLKNLYHFTFENNKARIVKYDESENYNFDSNKQKYFETKRLLLQYMTCRCEEKKSSEIKNEDSAHESDDSGIYEMENSTNSDEHARLVAQHDKDEMNTCTQCKKNKSKVTTDYVFVNSKANIETDKNIRISVKAKIKIPLILKMVIEIAPILQKQYEQAIQKQYEHKAKDDRHSNVIGDKITYPLDFENLDDFDINDFVLYLTKSEGYYILKYDYHASKQFEQFFEFCTMIYEQINKPNNLFEIPKMLIKNYIPFNNTMYGLIVNLSTELQNTFCMTIN